jgi:hypothetical protein
MNKPQSELIAGDVLCFGPAGGFWNTVGKAIGWFEWASKPGEALETNHVAVMKEPHMFYENNPGGTHQRPATEIEWERVTGVWRVVINNEPIFLSRPAVCEALAKYINAHTGEKYPYWQLGVFALMNAPARVGLPGVSKWMRGKFKPPASWPEVCSGTVELADEAAIQTQPGFEKFDLFPEIGEPMPSDFNAQGSPFLRAVV